MEFNDLIFYVLDIAILAMNVSFRVCSSEYECNADCSNKGFPFPSPTLRI